MADDQEGEVGHEHDCEKCVAGRPDGGLGERKLVKWKGNKGAKEHGEACSEHVGESEAVLPRPL